jgi:thymidine kinase|tara:strand:+ start:1558 stop:2076 length:519 start_codon:yes stop_codon:yes gene_type:complete
MSLKIIMGNMFSGKTSELVRRLKRYEVIGKNILVINSSKDTRCMEHVLRTHDNMKFECIKTNNLKELNYEKVDIIAIDEAQFFIGLKTFVEKALKRGKTIILTGLDGNYKQEKIGEILECIPLADKVFKLSAMCMECMDGTHGPFTKRIVNNNEVELIGGKEMYRAVCRKHL